MDFIAFRGCVKKSLQATEGRPTYRSPGLARLGKSEGKTKITSVSSPPARKKACCHLFGAISILLSLSIHCFNLILISQPHLLHLLHLHPYPLLSAVQHNSSYFELSCGLLSSSHNYQCSAMRLWCNVNSLGSLIQQTIPPLKLDQSPQLGADSTCQ